MLANQTICDALTPINPAKAKSGPTQQVLAATAANTALKEDKNDFILLF